MNSKKRMLAMTLIVAGGGYLAFDLFPSGPSESHTNKSSNGHGAQGVITQNVIKETTVIKAPEVLEVEPLPTPTEDDYDFLRRVNAKEVAQHAAEMATINGKQSTSFT